LLALQCPNIFDLLSNKRRSLSAATSADPVAEADAAIHASVAEPVLGSFLLETCTDTGIFAHTPVVNHISLKDCLIP
jgi:hypothetical protein